MSDDNPYGAWVRATWLGWLLGIPLVVVTALLGEAIGVGGAQAMVGLGMGIGVGWMQSRALRGWLPRVAPWLWSSALGLALPFLATDIAKAAGLSVPYSLYVCLGLGGLVVGLWQARLLRGLLRPAPWILASLVGWLLAGGTAAISDVLFRSHALRGVWGALAFLGIAAVGGLILGLITGIPLIRGREVDSG